MMKKLFAMLLIATLTLSAVAFAATYRYDGDDIVFTYDENIFEIVEDDHTDDEDSIVLATKDDYLGQTYVRIYLRDLEDGEKFPTAAEFTPLADVEVTQGEWNGYKDVFMYTIEDEDGTSDNFFIVPIYDDDGEIEDSLTIEICVTKVEDEEAAMLRDDAISEIVDTLRIDD